MGFLLAPFTTSKCAEEVLPVSNLFLLRMCFSFLKFSVKVHIAVYAFYSLTSFLLSFLPHLSICPPLARYRRCHRELEMHHGTEEIGG